MIHQVLQESDTASSGSVQQWQEYWDCARPHRETLTQMILDSAPNGARLCIWGAGTCHDLDLQRIVDHCHEVTLVDIHAENLQLGTQYQSLSHAPNLRTIAPVDLAGTGELLSPAATRIDSMTMPALIKKLQQHHIAELGHYDMIVSTGMLSQIILDIAETVDDRLMHAACVTARRHHLELMVDHLYPGGIGLLVTDFLNSDQIPELATTTDLRTTIENALNNHSPLRGLDPVSLQRDLLMHPSLADRVGQVSSTGYWLWKMTRRHYACFALRFQKLTNQKP